MNVDNQVARHTMVDRGTQTEPETGSNVGRFLNWSVKSVKHLLLHNTLWDADYYDGLSRDQKKFTHFLMSVVPSSIVSASCYAGARYMLFGTLGSVTTVAVGWAVGDQIGYMLQKEFFKECDRLEHDRLRAAARRNRLRAEAYRNTAGTSQSQRSPGPRSSITFNGQNTTAPPSYEESQREQTNIVRQRVHPDGLDT